MDHPTQMRVVHRPRQRLDQPGGLPRGGPLLLPLLGERAAVAELQREERLASHLACLVQLHDVRVLQAGHRFRLDLEAAAVLLGRRAQWRGSSSARRCGWAGAAGPGKRPPCRRGPARPGSRSRARRATRSAGAAPSDRGTPSGGSSCFGSVRRCIASRHSGHCQRWASASTSSSSGSVPHRSWLICSSHRCVLMARHRLERQGRGSACPSSSSSRRTRSRALYTPESVRPSSLSHLSDLLALEVRPGRKPPMCAVALGHGHGHRSARRARSRPGIPRRVRQPVRRC